MGLIVVMPAVGGPNIAQQIRTLTQRQKNLEKKVQSLAGAVNVTTAGSQGIQGPKGDTGPKGDAGPSGPISAFSGFTPTAPIGTAAVPVVSAPLSRAGNFLVQGNMILANAGPTATLVTCDLVFAPTGDVLDTASVRLGALNGLDTETLTVSGILPTTGPGDMRIDCSAGALGVTVSDADLMALG